MSRLALRTIWCFLGVLTLGFALTSALRTTGSAVEANILPLGTSDPSSAALVAFPLLTLLIATLLYVTASYAQHPDVRGLEPWESRIPIFYFDTPDVDPGLPDGRRYQRVLVAAFLLVPVLAQVLLLDKCFNGTAYTPTGIWFASRWRHFWPSTSVSWSQILGGVYRFGKAGDGVSYFPWVSPYLYACAEAAILVFAWHVWRNVRADGRRVRSGHSGNSLSGAAPADS